MKALPAPPGMMRSKSADSVSTRASTTATKATKRPYDPTHSTYKPTGTSYASPAAKKPEPKKPLRDGKVRISAESRPGGAAKTEPKPFKPYQPPSKSVESPSQGYQPPSKSSYQPPKPRLTETNLKSVPSSAPHIPGYAASAAGSVKSSVAPKDKGKSGGQGGQDRFAHIPGFAPSVAGSTAQKDKPKSGGEKRGGPAPSKAGSVAGMSIDRKFF